MAMSEIEAKSKIKHRIGVIREIAGSDSKSVEDLEIAVQVLKEIREYRELGTVEDIQKKMEELDRWHTDKINENIKNPFAYTSTLICHNCDHKDEYIEELETENAEYKSIGTVEELKALKEKNEPKKVVYMFDTDRNKHAMCPNCRSVPVYARYCSLCGQKVDWGLKGGATDE